MAGYSRLVMSRLGEWWRWLRIGWLDAALAAGLSVAAVLLGPGNDGSGFSPAVFLCTAPLLVRRRFPIPVFALALIGFSAAGDSSNLATLIGGLIAAVSIGLESGQILVGALAAVAGAILIAVEFGQGGHFTTLPIPPWLTPLLLIGSAYLAGRVIASQRDRAEQVSREHEAALQVAAATERRRIARELHDVIAHSVSVMVVQAGAARHVLDDKPEAARDSLLAVEQSGHEAMAELRRMLGVLGVENGAPAPLAPQPGMDRLDALVARVRETGLPVELRVEGEARPLPPGVDVAAYRIVQEALTNALKYAGGAPTSAVVRYTDDAIDIEVVDAGVMHAPAEGLGRGLMGMRERVAAFGGSIEAGARSDAGGYAVRAHLPISAA